MENIIQQITIKLIEQILENLRENGINNIGQTIQKLKQIVNSAVLEMVSAAIGEVDLALVAATSQRKADGLRVKQRNVPRRLVTELGELRYERTYFETKDGQRCYLTDSLIGVQAYERLTKELCAALVQQAADKSMQKAARDMGVNVSRQTVNNKVLALKEVAVEAVAAQETPRELHLFADEDHVHMKDGSSAIVPLVTVTEGIDVSQKRHKTKNAVHFAGYGVHGASLFENVAAFLYQKYDMDQVERVYVHADGAKWIRAAMDWLPNARLVMDGFHLEKRLRTVARLKGAAPYMHAIRGAIGNNDAARFASFCAKLDATLDGQDRQTLADNMNFILNNWNAIVRRMKNEVCGSCTEPLVSHILSARLSRNPLAWSETGLHNMVMLRVYVQNAGVLTGKDIRVSRRKSDEKQERASWKDGCAKYRAYADIQLDEVLRKKTNWSVFSPDIFRYGKLDGTHMLIKAYGQVHDNLTCA